MLKYLEYSTRIGCVLLFADMVSADAGVTQADALFRAYQNRMYQIRVIETSSGNKAGIGSGFSVGTNGFLASNYHVVSQAIDDPHLYRLEGVGYDGKTYSLKIIDTDVIHDLALLQCDGRSIESFELNAVPIDKGTTLFALGNPLDLGMAIVEGTYNGLLEKSFYEKIHFSASVNSGMSGGPTIDREGRVVGINVATMGRQISFLVPVKYLQKLLDRVSRVDSNSATDLHQRIEQDLIDNQNEYILRLMAAEWSLDAIGGARVPRIQTDMLEWWGDKDKDQEALYEHTYVTCYSRDEIFLSSSLSTGKLKYNCDWYVSKGLNAPRFYHLLEEEFKPTPKLNSGSKDDVTNFKIRTDFVKIAGRDWQVTLCARHYKKHPHLYDVIVKMASVTESDQALLVNLALSGVTEENGTAFVKKFMEAIRWQD